MSSHIPGKFIRGDCCCEAEYVLQVSEEVQKHLQEGGVTLKDYSAMLGDVKQAAASGSKIWADPSKVYAAATHAPCIAMVPSSCGEHASTCIHGLLTVIHWECDPLEDIVRGCRTRQQDMGRPLKGIRICNTCAMQQQGSSLR